MTSTYTRAEASVEAAVATDGTVYLADAGFPVQVTTPIRRLDPVRIKLVQLPLPGGVEFDYLFFAWQNDLSVGLMDWVNHIERLDFGIRQLTLASGEEVTYRPSGNCGCGSRLLSFNPWPSHRMVGIQKPSAPWDFTP